MLVHGLVDLCVVGEWYVVINPWFVHIDTKTKRAGVTVYQVSAEIIEMRHKIVSIQIY